MRPHGIPFAKKDVDAMIGRMAALCHLDLTSAQGRRFDAHMRQIIQSLPPGHSIDLQVRHEQTCASLRGPKACDCTKSIAIRPSGLEATTTVH